jgi:hypothetical protein
MEREMDMTYGTKINWAGDYSNNPRAGIVSAINGGMVSILWDDGATVSLPAFTITGGKWKIGA